jgi:spore coat protein U-like protein
MQARHGPPARPRLARLLAALLLACGAPAHALCVLCTGEVSVGPLGFGIYDPLSTSPKDSTATVTVSITGAVGLLVGYEVSFSPGQSSNASARFMKNEGSSQMQYNLYRDSARGTVLSNVTGATIVDSVTLNVLGTSSRNHTVYGRIPVGQTLVQPGLFTDTISVSVLF